MQCAVTTNLWLRFVLLDGRYKVWGVTETVRCCTNRAALAVRACGLDSDTNFWATSISDTSRDSVIVFHQCIDTFECLRGLISREVFDSCARDSIKLKSQLLGRVTRSWLPPSIRGDNFHSPPHSITQPKPIPVTMLSGGPIPLSRTEINKFSGKF